MSKRVPFDAKGRPLINEDYSRLEEHPGDGDPDCPKCGGDGSVRSTDTPPGYPPVYVECSCSRFRRIARKVEAGWKGLFKAPKVSASELRGRTEDNLWIRAKVPLFRSHLRQVAIYKIASRTNWFFKVVSDADLITAWLATAAMEGREIADPDFAPVSTQKRTLVDLVLPPDLLIINLGVKRAANKEMPGVLHEALAERYNADKPTWITDQPYAPLTEGHRAWSPYLIDSLEVWEYDGPILLGSQATYHVGVKEVDDEDDHELTYTPISTYHRAVEESAPPPSSPPTSKLKIHAEDKKGKKSKNQWNRRK